MSLFIEQGPSSILITAKRLDEDSQPDENLILEKLTLLQRDIKAYLPILRLKAFLIKNPKHLPWVVKEMIQAAKEIAPHELTPMSAVAGAVADGLVSSLTQEGFDLVVANNGGDIKLYSRINAPLKVGIGSLEGHIRARLVINGPCEMGIATSGLGGRSLTKGVADSVTILARSAALADAAATYICNTTYIDFSYITRVKAEVLNQDTDLFGEFVTKEVRALSKRDKKRAISRSMDVALEMKAKGKIYDAVIFVGNEFSTTIHNKNPKISLEVRDAH